MNTNTNTPKTEQPKSALQAALDIRVAQGWNLTGKAVPVLYTDSINGQQVLRDDLWLCTTAALAAPQPEATSTEARSLEPTNAQLRVYIDEFVTAGNTSMEGMLRGAIKRFAAQAPTAVQASGTQLEHFDPEPPEGSGQAGWKDIARHHATNEDYYRGLLEQCAKLLGPAAYTSNDGTVHDTPLNIKIPELVRAALATAAVQGDASSVHLGEAISLLRECQDAIEWCARECGHLEAVALARRIDKFLTTPARAAPGVQPADDEDMILVPRGLIGAACSVIDKKRDGATVLEKLRRYTTGDLSAAPAAPGPAASSAVPLTDAEIIEAVEEEVGMGHNGWDMVDGSELVAGFRKVLGAAASPALAPEQSHG